MGHYLASMFTQYIRNKVENKNTKTKESLTRTIIYSPKISSKWNIYYFCGNAFELYFMEVSPEPLVFFWVYTQALSFSVNTK